MPAVPPLLGPIGAERYDPLGIRGGVGIGISRLDVATKHIVHKPNVTVSFDVGNGARVSFSMSESGKVRVVGSSKGDAYDEVLVIEPSTPDSVEISLRPRPLPVKSDETQES